MFLEEINNPIYDENIEDKSTINFKKKKKNTIKVVHLFQSKINRLKIGSIKSKNENKIYIPANSNSFHELLSRFFFLEAFDKERK